MKSAVVKGMVFLVVAITLMCSGCVTLRNKDNSGMGNGTVDMIIDFNGAEVEGYAPGIYEWNGSAMALVNTSKDVEFRYSIAVDAPGVSVYSVLVALSKAAGFNVKTRTYSYGIFVEAIAGVENEGVDGRNWQYWVNGRYGEVSCDNKAVYGGDIIEWRFTDREF